MKTKHQQTLVTIKKFCCTVVITGSLLLGGCTTTETQRSEEDLKESAVINARLGLAYMQQGNFEIALEKLEKAIEQDPEQAIAHHYLAELYRQLNSPDDAKKHYQTALKLTPRDHTLHNNYGVFLCNQGDYDGAEKGFLMAVQTAPVHTPRFSFYENLAQCLLRKPDLEKAEQYFRTALDVNPNLPVSLYQMARISYDQGEYLRARAFYQRFTESSAHNAESLWLGYRIERKLGDLRAAAELARQLKINHPLTDEARKLMESERQ